jgi:urea transport system substrate-binding protein
MKKHPLLSICLLALSLFSLGAQADDHKDTIKVGVLHSLSGTMAISETTLKDTVLMMIEEQNKAGGLLGKKLEAVVVDPASDWPLFAEKMRGERPFLFSNLKKEEGLAEIIQFIKDKGMLT